jgi:ferredoxin
VKLRVNPIACDGHGLCAELLPELVRLDDWGYPIVEGSEVPRHLELLARRAVDVCPTLALVLENASPRRATRPAPDLTSGRPAPAARPARRE